MKLLLITVRIPVEKDGRTEYLKAASEKLGVAESAIQIVKILNKRLDAVDQEQFYYDLSLAVQTSGFDNKENYPLYIETIATERELTARTERPVVVGFGPAGMFAALELLAYGLKPIIFERGKRLEERSLDVQRFRNERVLDPESNIQFGEGGAGSYSDGKLFSRKLNTVYNNKVLDTFIRFGAPEEIGYVGKPHLGTDVLCGIVRNIRNYIVGQGGEIHYSAKMTDILLSDNAVTGVVINGNKEYPCSSLYLALGHSARDTIEMLQRKGVRLEQKALSVGVRVEHPVEVINLMRYGAKYRDFSGIGAATYSLNHHDKRSGKGVTTFCMCPGGEVVNASSEQGMLVVNGMSYSQRASEYSNSAIVVTCQAGDYRSADPLAGMEFQKDIEQKAFFAGGGKFLVPAQNLLDFLSRKLSGRLNANSCATGTAAADLHTIFPASVTEALTAAFGTWAKAYPMFVASDATLLGAETRTSSAVRIARSDRFESINIRNLYPIGEGSGYTGGITSSAADAIKAVETVLSSR